jgi:hypothetical protein
MLTSPGSKYSSKLFKKLGARFFAGQKEVTLTEAEIVKFTQIDKRQQLTVSLYSFYIKPWRPKNLSL